MSTLTDETKDKIKSLLDDTQDTTLEDRITWLERLIVCLIPDDVFAEYYKEKDEAIGRILERLSKSNQERFEHVKEE